MNLTQHRKVLGSTPVHGYSQKDSAPLRRVFQNFMTVDSFIPANS